MFSTLTFLGALHATVLIAQTDTTEQTAPTEQEQSDTDKAAALQIVIKGVDGALKENVEAFLDILQTAEASQTDDKDKYRPLPSESRIRWLHARAQEDIEQALQPFGYYRPTVNSTLEKTATGWLAQYDIDPGDSLKITSIKVNISDPGAKDKAYQDILDTLPLAAGDTLDHPKYEQIKSQLQSTATERGYFDASFESSQILIDLDTYQANININFHSGERYLFGPVTFKQDVLRDELLQRYVQFDAGDPYLAPDLLKLQSDLINSQYFDQVLIDADPNKAVDNTLPVVVTVDMRKRSKYTFGLGYGTDTGVRLRGDLERRWTNDSGHRMDIRALGSQIKSSLDVSYIIPGQDPRRDALKITGNVSVEDSDVKNSTSASVRVSRDLRLGPWTGSYGVEYLWEQFEFSGERETTQLFGLDTQLSYVSTTDRLIVKKGYSIDAEVYIANDNIISDISVLQGLLRSKWIYSIGDNHRMVARGQVGSTWIRDADFDLLPSSRRFFAGGDNSVRGYALDVIGPVNEENDVIGGRHLLVGSLEYEYRVYDQWWLAIFADSGDAFDNETPNFRSGAGLGVRWQSPIGPIRVDIAHGFDDPGDNVRLHLNIGPDL